MPLFDLDNAEFATWRQYSKDCSGMRHLFTRFKHGIVRRVDENGNIWEGSYKGDKMHGINRLLYCDKIWIKVSKEGHMLAEFHCD